MSSLSSLFGGGGGGGGGFVRRKAFNLANTAANKTLDLSDLTVVEGSANVVTNGSIFLKLAFSALSTSTDLITWTTRYITDAATINGYSPSTSNPGSVIIAYTGGYFWAVARNSYNDDPTDHYVSFLYKSSDGITWTRISQTSDSTDYYPTDFDLLTTGSSTHLLRNYGGQYQTSTDGITWTNRLASATYAAPVMINNIAYFATAINTPGKFSTNGTTLTSVNVNVRTIWYYNGYYYGFDLRTGSSIINVLYRGASLTTLSIYQKLYVDFSSVIGGSFYTSINYGSTQFPGAGTLVFNDRVYIYTSATGEYLYVLNKEGLYLTTRRTPLLKNLCNDSYFQGVIYGDRVVINGALYNTESTTELIIP